MVKLVDLVKGRETEIKNGYTDGLEYDITNANDLELNLVDFTSVIDYTRSIVPDKIHEVLIVVVDAYSRRSNDRMGNFNYLRNRLREQANTELPRELHDVLTMYG